MIMGRTVHEKLTFTDLPDVLIDRIVGQLESKDIIKLLYTSKKTQNAFKNNYHIVHDLTNDSSAYSKIPTESYTCIDDIDGLNNKVIDFKGTLLLEVHYMEQSWMKFFNLINLLSQQTTCKITIYNIEEIPFDLQESFHRIVNLSGVDKGFVKSIHLPEVKALHFFILNFDPSILKAPKLSKLALADCKIVDPGYKIKFPKLNELYIEEGIGEVLNVIEVPKTLYLKEVLDITNIKNLNSSNLVFLKIEACPKLTTLKDCHLPNLKHLEIYDTSLNNVSNLKSSNLINIVLDTNIADLSWENLDVENLKEIDIRCSSIRKFQNFNAPQLEYVGLKVYDQPILESYEDYENPCSALENVHILEVTSCLQVLEGLTFQNLETLNLQDEFDHRLTSNTKFPVLNNLFLCHNDLIQQVPVFNAPSLSSITVIGSFNFISINNIPEAYPSLKNLTIDNCALSTITDLHFPNLESLDIQSDVSNFTLTNCHFANLKKIIISPKANIGISLVFSDYIMKTFFKFTAPKLEYLMFTDMFITNPFSTSSFPELKELTLSHVEKLEIVDSEKLKLLDISQNEGLQKLDMGVLPNLKEFYPPRNMDPFTSQVLSLDKDGLVSSHGVEDISNTKDKHMDIVKSAVNLIDKLELN